MDIKDILDIIDSRTIAERVLIKSHIESNLRGIAGAQLQYLDARNQGEIIEEAQRKLAAGESKLNVVHYLKRNLGWSITQCKERLGI